MIVLPWPDKRLSPNARIHWAPLKTVKAAARETAWAETLSQMPLQARQALAQGDERIPVRITFYPPDKRHRDDDNMIAAFKAARDGIADALGVNDRRFAPHYFFEEPEKPGRIEVAFGPVENSRSPCHDSAASVKMERAGSEQPLVPGPDHNTCSGGADGSLGQ